MCSNAIGGLLVVKELLGLEAAMQALARVWNEVVETGVYTG